MNIASTGTGFISKIHAQAARNLGLTLAAVVNQRPESRDAFAARFGIARQSDTVEALVRDGGVEVCRHELSAAWP